MTTLALLWSIVLLAWTVRLVGVGRPARAEPLLRAMEHLAVLGVRRARGGAYRSTRSPR